MKMTVSKGTLKSINGLTKYYLPVVSTAITSGSNFSITTSGKRFDMNAAAIELSFLKDIHVYLKIYTRQR